MKIALQSLCLILLAAGLHFASAAEDNGGLLARFEQNGQSDFFVLPDLALFVDRNHAPSALLKPGPFQAEISGFVSVDLRSQYTFHVETAGELELLINGKSVLIAANKSETSRPVRLSKGTNSIVARFRSPAEGDAMFRILWAGRNHAIPVPITGGFTHEKTEPLARAMMIREGAHLAQEYRCRGCHQGVADANEPGGARLLPSLEAPSFAGIGSRLQANWMASWVLDPASHREQAWMPALLRGPAAAEEAEAIAAFLGTLTNKLEGKPILQSAPERGSALFKDLQCGSCHDLAGEPARPESIALGQVRQKFREEGLLRFLLNPQEHFRFNRMPNFRLSPEEASALAGYLLERSAPQTAKTIPAALAPKGRNLVQTRGCLNCHALELENKFSAPPMASLTGAALERGCLSPEPPAQAAKYQSLPAEKIRAYLSSSAPFQRVPHEEALRWTGALQCAQCHDAAALLPNVLQFGAKLRPEWSHRVIAGELAYKPRPWLAARMPGFPAYAEELSAGLAALRGYSAEPSELKPVQAELAGIGAKLISADGGFSCVACHAVGDSKVALIVESPGINLAHIGERLRKSYFHRWVMNPIAIDPATKMPVYFDEQGRSQLLEILEGDGARQIDAMWEYIRSLSQESASPGH